MRREPRGHARTANSWKRAAISGQGDVLAGYNLQALPGRAEFGYLPRNTQAVLLQPLCAGESMLVLGTDRGSRSPWRVGQRCAHIASLLREVR